MIKFRQYREDGSANDKFDVRALHKQTEEAIGRRMDFPPLTDHPVLRAEVAERDGKIVGGFYLESCPEVCFFGRDAEVTLSSMHHARETFLKLKEHGFRIVRLEVPRAISDDERQMIRRALKAVGFRETDSENEHYILDMRPGGSLG
jgi:hypothetical protein